MTFRHRSRALRWSLLLTAATLSCLIATLLTPLLLERLVPAGTRWQQLSAVGETYGAASAVISAFALVAIGFSLFLQVREMRFARAEAERAHHFQLMQLQIENPVLSDALSIRSQLDPRVHIYLNLVLSYWEMLFRVGEMTEEQLAEYARANFFGTEAGHSFWRATRDHRLLVVKDRRGERFINVMDQVWRQSLSTRTDRPVAGRNSAVVTATALVAAGIIWIRHTRRKQPRSRSTSGADVS
ncbi:DUF6082 family protein [Nonomuraea bangladeshensis]|uniref:DUF6082 family protein n=1 Tax=Nonomuraea bangladeshensis TaxID=404385 RepID=UPI003C2BDE1A